MLLTILISGGVAVGAASLVLLVIARTLKRRLEKIRRSLVQQVGLRESPELELLYQRQQLWAQSRQMEFLGAFRHDALTPRLMVVWKCPQPSSFFCVYQEREEQRFEFVSAIAAEPEFILKTANSHELFAFPLPSGHYVQSFPNANQEALRQLHAEAQVFLTQFKHVRFGGDRPPFSQVMEDALQRQIRMTRGRAFWALRYFWWYAISSSRWRNKTLAQQHREGLWR